MHSLYPPIDPNAEILLLIGRDVPSAHHVKDQCIGSSDAPFAQRTSLGWTIVGDVCLNGVHIPHSVSVTKTSLMSNGRPSLLEACDNTFNIIKHLTKDLIIRKTREDERQGLSVEDRKFLSIMQKDFAKDSNGNWVAPLPFRGNAPNLTSNREYALNRMNSLHKGLLKNAEKKKHMVDFMRRIFDQGHAEIAPPLLPHEERWYLPLFGVYHQKKPNKVCVVFDSSAKFQGVSLNDALLTGPDFTNSLLGILLRICQESVAVAADVEQMFHNFKVKENHRNFLKFFWYRNNNPDLDFIEYRMTVHVFGNTPSPAIASYGLCKSVEHSTHDVRGFVNRNFYVDDGLVSTPDAGSAAELISKTKFALSEGGNLRLHKIVSNDKNLLSKFQSSDLAEGLKNLDLASDSAPLQNSLGLLWDINTDVFTYTFSGVEKPFTKRGILSTINRLFDPMGFIAPIIIQGKLFLREVTSLNHDWDEPLP